MPIVTPVTRLLDINSPIIVPPMAGCSGGALAAAVTAGGGFGFIAVGLGYDGTGRDTVEGFEGQLSLTRSLLNIPASPAPLPIGIGFIGWLLDLPGAPGPTLLNIALENRPKAIWFSFGNDLGPWIKVVHEFNEKIKGEHKILIFAQVNTVEEARKAAVEWKVDAIVAQGIEAGGHGRSAAPLLFNFIPALLQSLPSPHPPIIAAGGISTGSQIASLLALGASACVVGTRFALSTECLYPPSHKSAIAKAGFGATVRTLAYDYAGGTAMWPEGINGRALRNKVYESLEGGASEQEIREKFLEAREKSDEDYIICWAGVGVALFNEEKPAEVLVRELHEEAVTTLKATSEKFAGST
ncbi:hypothetical protein JAAARDRAFT_31075 [Jaapia argillacea MUCL 33604]|uniref:Uncharacterized protein n=1 Tax=Jaapia argillacea MUCL 33604 TaxID=933084 RepID=A0A067Q608_9AGAM|nr:hypothetical protein JAAARDRAFT_31075 [Jaapia argillacea MUCL 33604]